MHHDNSLGAIKSINQSANEQIQAFLRKDNSITHLGDDTTGSVQTAQRIASGFFNNEPSFGLLSNQYSGYYFKLKMGGKKGGDQPGKKAEKKAKEKTIDDLTFGLKNKNKSAKV